MNFFEFKCLLFILYVYLNRIAAELQPSLSSVSILFLLWINVYYSVPNTQLIKKHAQYLPKEKKNDWIKDWMRQRISLSEGKKKIYIFIIIIICMK